MAAASTVHLVVSGEVDVDQEELGELTAQLRRRLLDLDVDDVLLGRSGAVVPEGAKPGEIIEIGALAVSLAPAVLRPVLHLVETWMQNRPVRTVKVDIGGRTIELGHASREQQERLVATFLQEVGTRAAADEGPPAADAAAGVADGAAEPPAVQE
jgi:hypothetical protein